MRYKFTIMLGVLIFLASSIQAMESDTMEFQSAVTLGQGLTIVPFDARQNRNQTPDEVTKMVEQYFEYAQKNNSKFIIIPNWGRMEDRKKLAKIIIREYKRYFVLGGEKYSVQVGRFSAPVNLVLYAKEEGVFKQFNDAVEEDNESPNIFVQHGDIVNLITSADTAFPQPGVVVLVPNFGMLHKAAADGILKFKKGEITNTSVNIPALFSKSREQEHKSVLTDLSVYLVRDPNLEMAKRPKITADVYGLTFTNLDNVHTKYADDARQYAIRPERDRFEENWFMAWDKVTAFLNDIQFAKEIEGIPTAAYIAVNAKGDLQLPNNQSSKNRYELFKKIVKNSVPSGDQLFFDRLSEDTSIALPTLLPSGFTLEEAPAILFIQCFNKDPFTGEAVSLDKLVPNQDLKEITTILSTPNLNRQDQARVTEIAGRLLDTSNVEVYVKIFDNVERFSQPYKGQIEGALRGFKEKLESLQKQCSQNETASLVFSRFGVQKYQ